MSVTDQIAPWSPYLGRTSLVSSGRKTLTMAFGELVQSRAGFPPDELPEIFAAPEDDGENDAARDLVRLDAEHLTRMFALGRLDAFARPLGGGDVAAIPAACWELDHPLPRFATGTMNLEHWANPDAAPTHRIFVGSAQFDEWLAVLEPLGPLTNRQIEEIVDPQLRAARAVAARKVTTAQGDDVAQSPGYFVPTNPPGVGPALLTIKEVCKLIGKSESWIHQSINDGKFPERLKLGSSARWKQTEVLAWIEEQAAKRDKS